MTNNFNWKEVWYKKGNTATDNLKLLNGYEKTNINPEIVAKQISEILNINSNTSLLEVGCGAGMLAQYFNCDYTGVDYSETLLKKHKQLLGNKLVLAEANELPFDDESFTNVFSFSVFQYFPNFEYGDQVIKEMFRVCKRGGKVFIGDLPFKSHSEEHILYEMDNMKKRGLNIANGFYNPERFNVWGVKK